MEIDYGTNNLKNVEQVENQISTIEQIDSGISNVVEVPAVRKITVGNVTTEQVESDQPADVDISTRTVEKTEYMDFDFEIPKGETGPYFTPTVDDEGNLSWTNNGDLTNPETVNIRGPQGIQGPQGPAGDAGTFDDALSETSTNGIQNKVVTNALNEKLGNSGEQTISDGTLTVSKTTTRESSAATIVNVQETTIHPHSIQSTISNSITNSSGNTTTEAGISITPREMNIDGNNFSFSIKTPDSSYYTPAAAILTSKKFHFFYTPTVSMDDGTSEDLVSESQVVRTDASQPLTDAEKQQAQKNITHTAWQDHATSGVQVGWYQVANLKTNGNYNIKIKQAYNYNFPEAIQLAISINHRLFTGQPFASITQLSGVNPGAFSLSKIRVRQGTDDYTTYLDVYNPDQLWNTTWVDITSDSQDVEVETNHPFEFIGTEDNPSGYKISSLDLVTGFNTSSLSVNNEEWQKTDFLTLDSGVGPINAVTDRGRNYLRNSMVETSGVAISTSGWYRVAQLTDYMSGKVDICKQYNFGLSQVVSIDFGLAYRIDASSSYLKVTSTPKFAATQCIDQVRIAQYTSDSTSYPYLEVHINAVSGENNSYWSVFKDISAAYGLELTSNFQMLAFEPASGTPTVTKVIDVKGETNVSDLNVNNTVIFSGTVSDLNRISQPVNSVVAYSFSGGCAHAPITDSGMVIQMQESTAFCTQLVIANDVDVTTWRRCYRNGGWTAWYGLDDAYNSSISNAAPLLFAGNASSGNITLSESVYDSAGKPKFRYLIVAGGDDGGTWKRVNIVPVWALDWAPYNIPDAGLEILGGSAYWVIEPDSFKSTTWRVKSENSRIYSIWGVP